MVPLFPRSEIWYKLLNLFHLQKRLIIVPKLIKLTYIKYLEECLVGNEYLITVKNYYQFNGGYATGSSNS